MHAFHTAVNSFTIYATSLQRKVKAHSLSTATTTIIITITVHPVLAMWTSVIYQDLRKAKIGFKIRIYKKIFSIIIIHTRQTVTWLDLPCYTPFFPNAHFISLKQSPSPSAENTATTLPVYSPVKSVALTEKPCCSLHLQSSQCW